MRKYLKAYILDIQKDYVILLTTDGQFIKYNVGSIQYEIGDEIIIAPQEINEVGFENLKFKDSVKINRNILRLLRGIAIGFAAVIFLAIGIFFSINYINKLGFLPSFSLTSKSNFLVKQDNLNTSNKIVQGNVSESNGKNAEENAEETVLAMKSEPQNETLSDKNLELKSDNLESSENSVVQQDIISSETSISASTYSGKIIILDENGNIVSQNQTDNEQNLLEIQKQPVLFEGFYGLDKFNQDFTLEYSDMLIGYRINKENLFNFQSTPSAWGATPGTAVVVFVYAVSIHAPRLKLIVKI